MSIFGAPAVIEKASSNMVSLDIYSKLLNERIVFCNGEIEDDMASDIVAQLLYLDALSKKPIKMYINSPGGSISAGLSIIDTMQYIESPVVTICTGIAASMASIILACGEKGSRKCLPHATVMIHQPSVGLNIMTTNDLTIQAKEMERVKRVTFGMIADATGHSIEEIYKDAERDNYMDADEAFSYGIIDEIIKR